MSSGVTNHRVSGKSNTRRVSQVEQELHTIMENLSSSLPLRFFSKMYLLECMLIIYENVNILFLGLFINDTEHPTTDINLTKLFILSGNV
jgi:hypothetical protein